MNSRKVVDIDCHSCPNKNCSVLKHCDDNWLSFISEHKVCSVYKKGQHIIYERTPVNGVYFVLSGKVKIYKTGQNGRELILRLAKPSDIVGHRGMTSEYYPASAVALEDTQICFLPLWDFEQVMRSNVHFTYSMMQLFIDELNQSEAHCIELSQLAVREKVAKAVLRLHSAYSTRTDNGHIRHVLSRQEIADMAATTKEQVSKHLADFQEEGLIQVVGKDLTITDMGSMQMEAGVQPAY